MAEERRFAALCALRTSELLLLLLSSPKFETLQQESEKREGKELRAKGAQRERREDKKLGKGEEEMVN